MPGTGYFGIFTGSGSAAARVKNYFLIKVPQRKSGA